MKVGFWVVYSIVLALAALGIAAVLHEAGVEEPMQWVLLPIRVGFLMYIWYRACVLFDRVKEIHEKLKGE